MSSIPAPDACVDYVWLQESIFHCHDKETAVREIRRVLKLNGMVVLEDTVLGNKHARHEVLELFGERVAINEILSESEIQEMFKNHNFTKLKSVELTRDLLRTYSSIIEFIEKNKQSIRPLIPPTYRGNLESAFGFPATLDLVKQGKLKCFAMFFRKL